MALAVFGDIHGNLEALEAILKDIAKRRRQFRIEDIYFLGDAISCGPNSSECLKLLEQYKVKCVAGNHEHRVVRYSKGITEPFHISTKHMEYVFNQLDDDNLRFIREMPNERLIKYKGKNVFFTHYGHQAGGAVKDGFKVFGEDTLDKLFSKIDCDIVFFGHLHSRKLLINEIGRSYFCLGSSGCVTNDKTFWTYFDISKNAADNIDIYRIDVRFNREKFEQKMISEPIPEKSKFAKECFGMKLKDEVK